ncbi:ribosome-inactivating family protein [Streptomyces sp. QH1-20]|uniref:ribosome-inactivating family protein n=1 Tax=Streptomyces sp. QH1-20 TaxID=3240934 RepID=UPI003516EAB0
MQLISAARSAGRRLSALFLALLATCALVNVDATPARADTNERWTPIEWDITGMSTSVTSQTVESRYRAMLDRLEAISSHAIADQVRDTMPQGTGRYIEVRVVDRNASTQHRLTLYFRADNLYLDGITAQGQNYRFTDAATALVTGFTQYYNNHGNMLWRNLPWTSNYSDLAGQEARGAASYTTTALNSYLNRLSTLTPNNWSDRGADFAYVIQATAEAARNGWIRNRIANSLGEGGEWDGNNLYAHIGGFGTDLERNYARLSRLTHRSLNGTVTDSDAVTINGRRYRNLNDMRNGISNGPRIAPFIALYGQ